jgi:hypothetical protein
LSVDGLGLLEDGWIDGSGCETGRVACASGGRVETLGGCPTAP